MWHADYLFEVYYRFEDYPSALRFVKIALNHLDPKSGIYDYRLSNMGETYLRLKDIPRAQAIFQQVIQTATAIGDTAYIGIASGHYGNTLRLQGQYREALPYLYLDVALNEKEVPEHSAIACAHIAVCLVHLDSFDKAKMYLQKAARLRQEWNWFSFFPPYYEASALYWKRRGDYRQASLYQDSLIAINDSLRERFNTSLLLTTSLTLKEERRLVYQRQKELETARLQLIRNLIIGLLVLLFSVVLVLLLRKRRKERERFTAQQQKTEERLYKAEGELAQYISAIKEKNKLIEQIEARLHHREDSVAGPKEGALQHLQNLAILTEDDWLRFKVLFTAVWPDFFDGLPNRYLDLSHGEVRLLALCKLELSSKEMAAMLGISQDSLRKSRYRLRKKYPQLTEDKDFKNAI
jgi:tetratricopeptide (TPR) repeat protein